MQVVGHDYLDEVDQPGLAQLAVVVEDRGVGQLPLADLGRRVLALHVADGDDPGVLAALVAEDVQVRDAPATDDPYPQHGYSLRAPDSRPRTKCFWKTKKMATVGMLAITASDAWVP